MTRVLLFISMSKNPAKKTSPKKNQNVENFRNNQNQFYISPTFNQNDNKNHMLIESYNGKSNIFRIFMDFMLVSSIVRVIAFAVKSIVLNLRHVRDNVESQIHLIL